MKGGGGKTAQKLAASDYGRNTGVTLPALPWDEVTEHDLRCMVREGWAALSRTRDMQPAGPGHEATAP